MANAGVSAQSNAVAGQSRLDTLQTTGLRSGGAGVRPVSAVAGIQRDFSFVQPQQAVQAKSQIVSDKPAAQRQEERRGGQALLSNGVQFLLAETRTQEAVASFVAPSSVGNALGNYQAVAARVRDTIRDNQGAAESPLDRSAGPVSGTPDGDSNAAVNRGRFVEVV